MSRDSDSISGLVDEIQDAIDGHRSTTIMMALILTAANVLANGQLQPGKGIDDACALFTKQLREMYLKITAEDAKP
jgi:hypothetical protein